MYQRLARAPVQSAGPADDRAARGRARACWSSSASWSSRRCRAARAGASRRRLRGAFWWRLIGSPLDAAEPGATLVDALWKLVRGASNEPRPARGRDRPPLRRCADRQLRPAGVSRSPRRPSTISTRRRDLVGARARARTAREPFEARRAGGGPREAEIVDFTGPQRDLARRLPAWARCGCRSRPRREPMQFPADSYWRGERHRVCDRPELAVRLIDELAGDRRRAGDPRQPGAAGRRAARHARRARSTCAARMGELVRSIETAAFDDACAAAAAAVLRRVRRSGRDHNPIGPFDFGGVYDEASDRQRTIAELIAAGLRRCLSAVHRTGRRHRRTASKRSSTDASGERSMAASIRNRRACTAARARAPARRR